jgi:MFS family permease
MQGVAVGWQIYALTHRTLNLGLVGFAQFLPMALLTLPAGHAADHFDRRKLCLLAAAAQAIGLAALGLGTWQGWITAPAIFALVAVIGSARAFERPASQALLPALVPKEVLPSALVWASSGFQAMSIAGPAIGGVLYAIAPAPCYFAAAGLAGIGAAMLAFLRYDRLRRPQLPASLESLLSGVRYIRSNSVVLGSVSLDLFAVLLGGAAALLPVYAHDILRVGSRGLGALRAAPAVGSLAMSLVLVRHPLRRRVGRKMFTAVLVFGAATIVFGLSKNFFLSLAALAALGAADMVSVVIRSSLVQLQTPDEMRGRVSAVNSLFIGTSNQLGEFESGVTAAWWGTVPATVLGGVGTLLVALGWMRLFPVLKNYDRFDPPKRTADE